MLLVSVILIVLLSICICYILRIDIRNSLEQDTHGMYDCDVQDMHRN